MRDKPDEAPQAAEKPRKKPNILLRLIAFLVTLALVVGAVALVAYRDELNFDSLRRLFTYRSLSRADSGQAQPFSHGGSGSDLFLSVDGGLLTCSTVGVRLFSDSGTRYVDEAVSLSSPAAMAAGNWSLAYDVGGREVRVFHGLELTGSLTMDSGSSILSARVNSAGYLAVTLQESGYRGAVAVYDSSLQHLLQLHLSSSFVMDAAVSSDNTTLAVVTMGQTGGVFESRLELYVLDHLSADTVPTPDYTCSLGNNVVLDLRESGGAFWALGETSVSAVSAEGQLLGSYDYSGRYLKEFSLEGDGYTTLLLGRYQTGSQADLVTVGPDGAVLSSRAVEEQVLSLSAAGRYVALLTADRLEIYTSGDEPYSTLEGTSGAQKVLMRSDGTAMLVSSREAWLYIPE